MPTENQSNTEMVSVPREPTREMLVAAQNVNGILPIWRAMVAAAPAEQSQGESVAWENAERLANIPAVHEALQMFSDDPTGDAGTSLVREVLEAVHDDPGEVERLRAELADTREAHLNQSARLVKANQEIERLKNPTFADTIKSPPRWVRAALSASAEPSAPKDWCTTMERPKSKCGCPDCGSSIVQMVEPSAPVERDERADFDTWFRKEKGLHQEANTTYIDAAFLPFRAWQARAALERNPHQHLELIHRLHRIGTHETSHALNGSCPDEIEGHAARDNDCPACQALMDADELLNVKS